MKNILETAILMIFASSFAFADSPIQLDLNLSSSDSMALEPLTLDGIKTSEPDPGLPGGTLFLSNVSTADGAFQILCSRNAVGLAKCQVKIDSSKSHPSDTTISRGVVGSVVVIEVSSQSGVDLLKDLTKPNFRYHTFEHVSATLPNGNKISIPRLQIDCLSQAAQCQILVMP